MKHSILWRIMLMMGAFSMGISSVFGADAFTPAQYSRMVFFGSSTTDGNTYPTLIQQALAEAKHPVPLCINAGIGGNVAAEMLKRIDRDVLFYKPTMVIIQSGSNDVSRKVPIDDYIQTVKKIIERLQAEKILVIAVTTNIRGEKLIADEKTVVEFNDALRKLAETQNVRIADSFSLQAKARTDGKLVIENDGLHPNFLGQSLIARAILDVMGFADVPVPAKQNIKMYPGVITEWQIKPVADGKVLDEQSVAALAIDESWVKYKLPEIDVMTNWWLDSERQRGFAVSLSTCIGKAKRYYGIANIDAEKPRDVYLNTGAGLQTIWLNGKRVYKNVEYTGWHAGRERLPVKLQAGKNVLVIEAVDNFFLSATDVMEW
ncbi:MAG: GDSL-type esterase/lipase family protein [bacterium]